jgi:hypothetical protein
MHVDVTKMTHIYVKTQVLAVVNTETTVVFGVMWHRVDQYHHSEEPAVTPSCYILLFPAFLPHASLFFSLLKEQLHYVPVVCPGYIMEVLYIM